MHNEVFLPAVPDFYSFIHLFIYADVSQWVCVRCWGKLSLSHQRVMWKALKRGGDSEGEGGRLGRTDGQTDTLCTRLGSTYRLGLTVLLHLLVFLHFFWSAWGHPISFKLILGWVTGFSNISSADDGNILSIGVAMKNSDLYICSFCATIQKDGVLGIFIHKCVLGDNRNWWLLTSNRSEAADCHVLKICQDI